MKILVLGASGRTGQLVVLQALEKGHDVVALVRDSQKFKVPSEKVSIVQGTPENSIDVQTALIGCDAVISVLNNTRSSDLPWSKPVSPPNFMREAIRNVVAAMSRLGVKRLVVMSGEGAGDSFNTAPWFKRFLIKYTNMSQTYADHNAVDTDLHANKKIDWTIARAAILIDDDSKKTNLIISYSGAPRPASYISRMQVARFMVDCIDKPEFYQKAPVVSAQ